MQKEQVSLKTTETFQLQQALQRFLPTPLTLKLNENSSHFISIRFAASMRQIFASIHTLFTQAPSNVIEALALYIRKRGKDKSLTQLLRNYITIASTTYRPSGDRVNPQGKHYDLAQVFEGLNERFFSEEVRASLSWFQSPKRARPVTQCSLGLYVNELNLIKINVLLDSISVPEYVLDVVVYHEMLHIIYPPKTLPSGKRIIHTEEFRHAERQHPKFLAAERWLEGNRDRFFDMRKYIYGRT